MKVNSRIRIVVAEDSPTALQSVCDYLESQGAFEIVGTASDGQNAIQQAILQQPDLVLLDLSMPRMNGLEAANELRKLFPELRLIIFSELNGLSLADECMRRGASSFVPKSRMPEGLLTEIWRLFSKSEK